ncbi:MAG: GTPase ObgE [Flavobacteriales bacterium]|nr:GTPase ObgE [Flavobacteriales bacterium]
MSQKNFVDYVKIHLRSGNGGPGSTHFLRSKNTAKGGPDGGDGGRGGHVILRGNRNLWTLLHFKYKKHIKADHGESGTGNLKTGADGKDVILEVPLGTVARDAETMEELFEIRDHGEERILMEGGMGGRGNNHFKTSTNQAPRYAQPGIPGEEGWRILELKVLADVGLVGFPNVGKSTLLASISAAKPEIADYEFTTLTPNLGIVPYRDDRSFIMADIPGIIENAHQGKGLGLRFLRHIERNSVLLFTIPADADDIGEQYNILLNELRQYNPELLDKGRLLAITKSDLADAEMRDLLSPTIPEGVPHVFISAVAQEGLMELKDMIWNEINR